MSDRSSCLLDGRMARFGREKRGIHVLDGSAMPSEGSGMTDTREIASGPFFRFLARPSILLGKQSEKFPPKSVVFDRSSRRTEADCPAVDASQFTADQHGPLPPERVQPEHLVARLVLRPSLRSRSVAATSQPMERLRTTGNPEGNRTHCPSPSSSMSARMYVALATAT